MRGCRSRLPLEQPACLPASGWPPSSQAGWGGAGSPGSWQVRPGSEVPSALCVCPRATAFLSVLLHVRSTCSHRCCCGVPSCAGETVFPVSRGCEPCLVFVLSVHGPVPLPAFNMTRPSLKLALVALALFKLEKQSRMWGVVEILFKSYSPEHLWMEPTPRGRVRGWQGGASSFCP